MTENQHLGACALLLERQHGESAYLHASPVADRITELKSARRSLRE